MKVITHIFLSFFACILLVTAGYSQADEQKLVREGNKLYKDKKFSEAGKKYTDALGKKADSYRGAFNLGDAYYQQGKYKEAAEQFEMLSSRKTGNDTLSKVYHNLGNSYLKQKEFEKGINAYKNALKRNADDEDSRYNLAYAQKMLKQQQQQQKQEQDKKDKEKKEENKEQDKDKKEDKNKEKDKKKEEQQEQQQKQEISKEDAQRLLEAMNNDEKKLRDKMNEKKAKGSKMQIEKDW
jgi:Ca-activated chloride channel family protein